MVVLLVLPDCQLPADVNKSVVPCECRHCITHIRFYILYKIQIRYVSSLHFNIAAEIDTDTAIMLYCSRFGYGGEGTLTHDQLKYMAT